MVERYGAARLLSFDHDAATREPTFEVAHEAVLRALAAPARVARRRSRRRCASTATSPPRRPGGSSATGTATSCTGAAGSWPSESLLGDPAVALNAHESEFLTASIEQRAELDAVARRRTRRRRYVTAAMAVVAALALAASVVALRQRDRADAEAAEARQNAVLAADNATLAEARAAESDRARQDAESERARADRAAAAADRDRQQAEEATAAGDLQRLEAQAVAVVEQRRRPGGPPRRRGPPDQRLRVERQRAAPCAVEHWRRRGHVARRLRSE